MRSIGDVCSGFCLPTKGTVSNNAIQAALAMITLLGVVTAGFAFYSYLPPAVGCLGAGSAIASLVLWGIFLSYSPSDPDCYLNLLL